MFNLPFQKFKHRKFLAITFWQVHLNMLHRCTKEQNLQSLPGFVGVLCINKVSIRFWWNEIQCIFTSSLIQWLQKNIVQNSKDSFHLIHVHLTQPCYHTCILIFTWLAFNYSSCITVDHHIQKYPTACQRLCLRQLWLHLK